MSEIYLFKAISKCQSLRKIAQSCYFNYSICYLPYKLHAEYETDSHCTGNVIVDFWSADSHIEGEINTLAKTINRKAAWI